MRWLTKANTKEGEREERWEGRRKNFLDVIMRVNLEKKIQEEVGVA